MSFSDSPFSDPPRWVMGLVRALFCRAPRSRSERPAEPPCYQDYYYYYYYCYYYYYYYYYYYITIIVIIVIIIVIITILLLLLCNY